MLKQMLGSYHVQQVFLKHKFRFLKQQHQNKILHLPVLGSFWGIALWSVLISHVRLLFLSQGSVVQTAHETCSSLILHCQKSRSPCLMQSFPTLLIVHLYWRHCLHGEAAFAEDSWTFAQVVLKRNLLLIFVNNFSERKRWQGGKNCTG